ncbi:MAG TPA: hypothetical protein VGK67_30480 [Myxococcales bacterium]
MAEFLFQAVLVGALSLAGFTMAARFLAFPKPPPGPDSDEVRLEVIAALARMGSVHSVEPLLALEGKAVKGAARDAARAIQARLGDADAGRLSVVDACAGEGAVSLEASRVGEKSGERSRGRSWAKRSS